MRFSDGGYHDRYGLTVDIKWISHLPYHGRFWSTHPLSEAAPTPPRAAVVYRHANIRNISPVHVLDIAVFFRPFPLPLPSLADQLEWKTVLGRVVALSIALLLSSKGDSAYKIGSFRYAYIAPVRRGLFFTPLFCTVTIEILLLHQGGNFMIRVITILMYAVTIKICVWILIRLSFRGCCEKVFDPGHSPWDKDQWIIAPKWPFLLACTTFFFAMRASSDAVIVSWELLFLFWLLVYFKAICEFRPIFKSDRFGYEDEELPCGPP